MNNEGWIGGKGLCYPLLPYNCCVRNTVTSLCVAIVGGHKDKVLELNIPCEWNLVDGNCTEVCCM